MPRFSARGGHNRSIVSHILFALERRILDRLAKAIRDPIQQFLIPLKFSRRQWIRQMPSLQGKCIRCVLRVQWPVCLRNIGVPVYGILNNFELFQIRSFAVKSISWGIGCQISMSNSSRVWYSHTQFELLFRSREWGTASMWFFDWLEILWSFCSRRPSQRPDEPVQLSLSISRPPKRNNQSPPIQAVTL